MPQISCHCLSIKIAFQDPSRSNVLLHTDGRISMNRGCKLSGISSRNSPDCTQHSQAKPPTEADVPKGHRSALAHR